MLGRRSADCTGQPVLSRIPPENVAGRAFRRHQGSVRSTEEPFVILRGSVMGFSHQVFKEREVEKKSGKSGRMFGQRVT